MKRALEDSGERTCPVCEKDGFEPRFEHHDRSVENGREFTVVQCRECGLVSFEPFPSQEELAALYPQGYYAHASAGESLDPPSGLRGLLDDLHLGLRANPLLKALLFPLMWHKSVYGYAGHLRDLPRGRLLDVGCGDGAFLAKAARMGFAAEGLDPWCTTAPTLAERGIVVHPKELHEFEAPAAKYDVITLNHVFEHLRDPNAALARLRNLLAPDGKLLVRMPRTDHHLHRRHARSWVQLDMPRHLYLYTPENFERLARRHGFTVESTKGELLPIHLQQSAKAALFGVPFTEPHWIDHMALSFPLLPVCSFLKAAGQADSMAVWLRPAGGTTEALENTDGSPPLAGGSPV